MIDAFPTASFGQGRGRWGSSGRHCRVEGDREVQSWPPARRLLPGVRTGSLAWFRLSHMCFLFASVTKGFPDGSVVKNLPASAGDSGNTGSIPRLGKNTGVGCHFLLQCRKGKSESEVAQSRLTLATPWTAAAYQPPQSMGFSRQKYWSGVPLR